MTNIASLFFHLKITVLSTLVFFNLGIDQNHLEGLFKKTECGAHSPISRFSRTAAEPFIFISQVLSDIGVASYLEAKQNHSPMTSPMSFLKFGRKGTSLLTKFYFVLLTPSSAPFCNYSLYSQHL